MDRNIATRTLISFFFLFVFVEEQFGHLIGSGLIANMPLNKREANPKLEFDATVIARYFDKFT